MSRGGATYSAAFASGRASAFSRLQNFQQSKRRSGAVAGVTSVLFRLLLLCFVSSSGAAAGQTNDTSTVAAYASSDPPAGQPVHRTQASRPGGTAATKGASRTAVKVVSNPTEAAAAEALTIASAGWMRNGAGDRKGNAVKGSEQGRTYGYAARTKCGVVNEKASAALRSFSPTPDGARQTPEDVRKDGGTAAGGSEAGVDIPVAAAASSGASPAAPASPVTCAPATAVLMKPFVDVLAADARYSRTRLPAPAADKALAVLRAPPLGAAAVKIASLKVLPAGATTKGWWTNGPSLRSIATAALAAGATSPAVTPAAAFTNAVASAVAAATPAAATSPAPAAAPGPPPAATRITAKNRLSEAKTGAIKKELLHFRSTAEPKGYHDTNVVEFPTSWYEESSSSADIQGAADNANKTPMHVRRRRAGLRGDSTAVENLIWSTESSVSDEGEQGSSSSDDLVVASSEDAVRRQRGRKIKGVRKLARMDPRIKPLQLRRRRKPERETLNDFLGGGGEVLMSLGAILSVIAFSLGVSLRNATFSESPHVEGCRDLRQQNSAASDSADGRDRLTTKPVAVPSNSSSTAPGELLLADASSAAGERTPHEPAEDSDVSHFGRLQRKWWDSLNNFERGLLYLTAHLLVIWCTQISCEYPSALEDLGAADGQVGGAASGQPTTANVVDDHVNTEQGAQETASGQNQETRLHEKQPPSLQQPDPAGTEQMSVNSGFMHSVVPFLLNRLATLETALIVVALLRISRGLLHSGDTKQGERPRASLSSFLMALQRSPSVEKHTGASFSAKPPLPTAPGAALSAALKKAEDDVLFFISEASNEDLTRVTVAAQEELLAYLEDMKQETHPVKQALKIAAVRELVERWTIDQLMQDLTDIREAAGANQYAGAATREPHGRHSSSSITRTSRSSAAGTATLPPLTRQEELYWRLEIAEHARSAIAWIAEEQRLLHLMTTAGGYPRSNGNSSNFLAFLSTVVPTCAGDVVERDVADRYLALRRFYYSEYAQVTEAEMQKPNTSRKTRDSVSDGQVNPPRRVDLFRVKRSENLRAIQALMRRHPQLAYLLPTHAFSWRLPLP